MKLYKNVDEYIKSADPIHQISLQEVRTLVINSASDIIEEIAYGMPAYTWRGKSLFYFAAMKGHLGLYPTPGPILELKDLLSEFSTSKGCVRIPYSKAVPRTIIKKLLNVRLKEIKSSI